jgi:hypothetical protein
MRIRGIYPELWKSGRDPIRHKLWLECQRNRAQAKYRGQEWEITEEEFIELWMLDDRYKRRGKGSNNLCMTRINKNESWNRDNVYFPTRKEHFQSIYLGISHKNREIECKR